MILKLKIDIDEADIIYFDTFPNEYFVEGKIYNDGLEYYFKFPINKNRFCKIFGNIFSNKGPNFFPA